MLPDGTLWPLHISHNPASGGKLAATDSAWMFSQTEGTAGSLPEVTT